MNNYNNQNFEENWIEDDNEQFGASSDDLRKGIWPRSTILWMSAFYMLLFIMRPWEKLLPYLAQIHFERIYAILMIVVLLISSKKSIRFNFHSVTVLLFFVAVFISAVFAWKPILSWEPLYEYVSVIIFYFILFFVVRTHYDLIFIIITYVISMLVYLAKSQWEFFVNGQHRYDMGVIRMIGIEYTFGGPNALAMSITASLPFLYFLWIERKNITETWPPFYRKWFSPTLIIYFLLASSSLVLTNSRSGMLGFVVFILLTGLRGRQFKKKLIYLMSGVIVLAIVWNFTPDQNKNRFRTIWDSKAGPSSAQASADGRIEGFWAGIKMFQKYPVCGVGIGNFNQYRIHFIDGVNLASHNLIGQVLGQTGVIGGLTFLLLIFTILLTTHKTSSLFLRNTNQQTNLFITLSIAIRNSVLLLLVGGMFGHNLYRYNWLWLVVFATLNFEFAQLYFSNRETTE